MKFIGASFASEVGKSLVFRPMVGKMEQEIDRFIADFYDDPSLLSAWGHNYFCGDDGGRLVFDVDHPHEHVCSICKKVYRGQPWDGVWVYFYRNLAMVTALKASAVYKATGITKYKDHAVRIIGFYAENYGKFALHNKEGKVFASTDVMQWGCGRILPQGLNESILCIRMMQALELLKDDLDPSFLKMVHDSMVVPFYSMIMPQVRAVHNIPCWNLSALGACAAFFGDKDVLDFVLHGEFNLRRQLHDGVTEDGFWYEGSIHYNFFLLEGVVTFAVFCKVYSIDFGSDAELTIQRMLVNAYALAFDNHRLPVPNDGWPDINLKTFSYVYYLAAKVFGEESPVGNLVKNIEGDGTERTTLPLSESYYCGNRIPLERLLFAYDYDMKHYQVVASHSQNYPLSNFAMLRKGRMNLFLKYGLNGPSHAHPDIMNIEVSYGKYLISRDLSNAGYQSRLCNAWHRKTLSHNTVCCDGLDITSRNPGRTVSFTPESIDVFAENVYAGVSYRRNIAITADGFDDVFVVSANRDVTADHVFHIENTFHLDEDFLSRKTELGFSQNGYELLSDVREVEGGSEFSFHGCGETIYLAFPLEGGQRLFVCRSMDNPVNKKRTTFIIRGCGREVVFKMHLSLTDKE